MEEGRLLWSRCLSTFKASMNYEQRTTSRPRRLGDLVIQSPSDLPGYAKPAASLHKALHCM